jgi:hypothetical protein
VALPKKARSKEPRGDREDATPKPATAGGDLVEPEPAASAVAKPEAIDNRPSATAGRQRKTAGSAAAKPAVEPEPVDDAPQEPAGSADAGPEPQLSRAERRSRSGTEPTEAPPWQVGKVRGGRAGVVAAPRNYNRHR